jgi:hypothetical protein
MRQLAARRYLSRGRFERFLQSITIAVLSDPWAERARSPGKTRMRIASLVRVLARSCGRDVGLSKFLQVAGTPYFDKMPILRGVSALGPKV